MFHHLQVYLRQDRDLRLRLFKSPPTLVPSDSRKIRLATNDLETTTSYSAPLIRVDPQPDNSSSMAQPSWRSFAATHLAPIKDYLAHRSDQPSTFHHSFFRYPASEIGCDDGDAKKQTSWTPFSSRRFVNRSYGEPESVTGTESIVLLPGWASRRYRAGSELSNRTGKLLLATFCIRSQTPMVSQVPRMTLKFSSLGMSSSTGPQTHYHVPNERY